MNIAFFSKHLPSDQPNGVSVQVDRLANALADRGHAVTCFSFSPLPEGAKYTLSTLTEGRPLAESSRLLNKFIPAMEFRKINTASFDICHYHGDDYLCRGSASRVRTFYGSALYEALHAAKLGRLFYQLLFYKLEWLSCFRKGTLVTISAGTKKALPPVRHVIPCGVPLDRYTPALGPGALKTENPSVLFIGDFKSRKQGDLLLGAFQKTVLPAFPTATLTVVGPESAAAPNVTCLGRIDEYELIREYQKAWVYCLPSSYEGFGVPAIEAMACGTAVVAVDNPGTRDLIKNGMTGILCSRKRLGNSITMVFGDNGIRNCLVTQGLAEAKKYDMRVIAERYEVMYKKALGGRKARMPTPSAMPY